MVGARAAPSVDGLKKVTAQHHVVARKNPLQKSIFRQGSILHFIHGDKGIARGVFFPCFVLLQVSARAQNQIVKVQLIASCKHAFVLGNKLPCVQIKRALHSLIHQHISPILAAKSKLKIRERAERFFRLLLFAKLPSRLIIGGGTFRINLHFLTGVLDERDNPHQRAFLFQKQGWRRLVEKPDKRRKLFSARGAHFSPFAIFCLAIGTFPLRLFPFVGGRYAFKHSFSAQKAVVHRPTQLSAIGNERRGFQVFYTFF